MYRCIWKPKRVALSLPTETLQTFFLYNLSSSWALDLLVGNGDGEGELEIKILQVCLWNLGGGKITKRLISAQPWFGFHGVD